MVAGGAAVALILRLYSKELGMAAQALERGWRRRT